MTLTLDKKLNPESVDCEYDYQAKSSIQLFLLDIRVVLVYARRHFQY
jgi:hypothetical protein